MSRNIFHGLLVVSLASKLVASLIKFFGCHLYLMSLLVTKVQVEKMYRRMYRPILNYIKVVLLKSAHTLLRVCKKGTKVIPITTKGFNFVIE